MVNTPGPYIRIIEQPAERSVSFEYEDDAISNCIIMGARSTTTKPTYPTIEIRNYTGIATFVISRVTVTAPHKYVEY